MTAEDRSRLFARRFTLKAPDRNLADGDECASEAIVFASSGRRVTHRDTSACMTTSAKYCSAATTYCRALPRTSAFGTRTDGDPLGKFLESLHKVASLGAKTALPAHREPIDDLPGRIEELLAHHVERETQVLNVLSGEMTGTEVASRLTWRRNLSSFDDLPASERSFALVETLAHLEHLRANGTVEKIQQAGVYRYRPYVRPQHSSRS